VDHRDDGGTAYTEGNRVDLLIHGRSYFERLYACLCEMRAGDSLHFADWRGDPDQELIDGEELATVLAELAGQGVKVRGLVWRSHPKVAGFHLEHHVELAQRVNDAGGLILLDQRVRPAGSHHQKLVLLRHVGAKERDIAFVGGIDLCHGRRDDARHLGDAQIEELDEQYGPRPPWHDIQVAVQGPAVGELDLTFRERWNDPTTLADRRTPWRALISWVAKQPDRRDRLPEQGDDPEPTGSHAIQVLRTYPVKRPPYPFARRGERSVVRAYRHAFARARCLIYVEDQYLWSREVATLFTDALRRAPELHVMVVVPRIPDRNGPISGPPHRVAQLEVAARLRAAGGDRVAIYDLENEDGVPIYVHAKTVVIDDVWAAVGSDNLNRRSWTHDSELSLAVLDAERDTRTPDDPGGLGDGARSFARRLRTTLLAEHLDVSTDALVDPMVAFEMARSAALELDRWHDGGRNGPRPTGRLRVHHLPDVKWWEKTWAWPLYRTVVDPDGRSFRMKRDGSY
jgi:phosphatidylserine/phosphatidylglycerophosphate/cardiolipin synthase-like enzyme